MSVTIQAVCFSAESEDQEALLDSVLTEQVFLSQANRKMLAWAAALACRDQSVIALVKNCLGALAENEKRELLFAVNRMSVTNPYFVSRGVIDLAAGGTLDALSLRSFEDIKVTNEIAYHYACVGVSMVNGGYNCFRSHSSSLRQLGETDQAIDQALRITAALMAARQISFNQTVL
ncbi:carboxymuconolactone decarboxylase family protein [Neptunomonas antarctica]|uniref:Alkyl hydroperoxide reductase subunit D n=1 Tax=Neptunomonas antarctica TaxID=619304 RepID=A0A1N7LHL9_9GAMM|nr:carboxymuconolactone decarboxylase family protein [Neptunomonas antarctica]SIS73283.1 alkyl hydroperoxide reductase subunit D [Neptunomonas antarctica]